MTTNSYKLGNGKLLLGTGSGFDVTGQLRACQVDTSEEVKTADAIPLLDNTEIAEEEEATFKHVLKGKFLQDLAANGIVDYSWEHMGEQINVRYVPHLPAERGVEGVIVMVPLTIGGEVTKPRTRPESDFEWRFVGTPIFGTYDPVDSDVDEDV